MKITAEPRSDQLNADDLIGRTMTVTIADVKPGTAEQKYDIHLREVEGRVWRPPLTVLRVLMAAYTDESANWIGKRATLYRDDKVSFGSDAVGGIRVSHLSDLPDGKPLDVKVTTKRGRRTPVRVQPLVETAPPTEAIEPTAEQVAACTDLEQLGDMWRASGPDRRAQIEERVAEIRAAQPTTEDTLPTGDEA